MDIPGLIRSLPGVVFFFVCAFAAAFVAIGLYAGWRSYRLAGLIATTRVTAASAAQEGMTAIEGKASVASDSMEEPMEAIEDDPSGEFEHAEEETKADEFGEEAEEWEVLRARQLAPAHLAKRGQNHYLISTLPRAEALKMHRLGVAGALWIALIGALFLAGVLVMRYGHVAGR